MLYTAIIWTVVVLAVAVVGLSVFVVLRRIIDDRLRAGREWLRARMTDRLQAFIQRRADMEAVIAVLRVNRAVALDALVRAASVLPSGDRARLLPLFGHFGFIAQETAALGHGHWGRRVRAASHLGVMSDTSVVPALIHVLGDQMLDVRLAAAHSLAQLRAPDAVVPILHSLALPGELPGKLAADVLSEFGDAAVPPLHAFLRDQDASTNGPAVAVAITALGMCRAAASVPLLIDILGDPEPELRASAARALGLIGSPAAVSALSERILDPVWQVRSVAAQALGRTGDAKAIPALVGRLVDVAWWVRSNAAEALFLLGDPGRERLLDALAQHGDRYARDISRQVLEKHASARMPEGAAP